MRRPCCCSTCPTTPGRGAFLVLFLVIVTGPVGVQEAASRRLRRRPVARAISRSFSWRAWAAGLLAAPLVGALLYWSTPFDPLTALAMGFVAGGAARWASS